MMERIMEGMARAITLHQPKRLEIGAGAARRLGDWAAGCRRAYVLATEHTAGYAERLGLDCPVTVFADVQPEPDTASLEAALAAARKAEPDLVVGLGGGSVMDLAKLVAVGYSTGANVAASLMLLHPRLLSAAVLIRAMVPFEPEETPDLSGMPVFIAAGRMDRMIPPDNTQRLADILLEAGADVDLRWRDAGHPLTYEDVAEAKAWLSDILPKLSRPQDGRE
jgi:predicted esterase